MCVCVCVFTQMVNRSFIVKQLQKPAKGLRRRVPARNVSGNTVVSTTASNSAPTAATGVQSVGAQELHGSSLSSTNVGLPSPSSPQGATHTGTCEQQIARLYVFCMVVHTLMQVCLCVVARVLLWVGT